MKKLLSLLSVVTISGTAIPTTIAASPYQKEEQNNDNLENLNRVKRMALDLVNEIRNSSLGTLRNDDSNTIFDAVAQNNRNLDMSKIHIGDKGDGWARIDANYNQDKYIPGTWKVVTWYLNVR